MSKPAPSSRLDRPAAPGKNPDAEIERNNPWYVEDQFDVQLGNPASEHVIRNRWRIFEKTLFDHLSSRTSPDPIHLLDVGCGDGINLHGLAEAMDRGRARGVLIGCDYNRLRIQRATRLPGVAGTLVSSFPHLPFPANSIDFLLCNHVLEHLPDDVGALHELRRVLRPDGVAILGVPNEGCVLAQLRNHVVQRHIARTTDHVQFYTENSFLRRLHATGFYALDTHREGFFVPSLRWNSWLARSRPGRSVLRACLRILPSQAAGLIFVVRPS